MRVRPALALLHVLSSFGWAQQQRPSIGMWVTGPVGNAHDLVPDAVTISQLEAGNRLIGNATTFLACKGNTGGPPSLELRFLPNPFQGYVQGTQAATMSFDGDNHPVSLETFPVQNKPLFIVQPGPAEAQKIAGVAENRSTTLSVRFKAAGGQEMSFILTLRPAVGPVGTVLTACHVNIPAVPRSGTPVSAAAVPAGPPHPASTVVDLPPAAPGYPPLHASRPADAGCWWTPFVSEKFGLEMAVQKCAKPAVDTLFGETAAGITEQYQRAPLPPPDVIFTVHTKPAEQPIEAAIKQQFIAKLMVPAARTSCQAKRQTEGFGKWDMYTVSATGPYANLKKFHSDEPGGDLPCEGIQNGDVSNYFLYQPAESKTKFLFIQGQVDSPTVLPYDEASIRFHTEP